MAGVIQFNLGPKNLKKGTTLSLAAANFAAVQRYVIFGLQLPSSEVAFRQSMVMPEPEPIGEFTDLRDAYFGIHEHVTRWHVDTFPTLVDLAGDIVHYAGRVRVYYKPLMAALEQLQKNPENAKAKKKFNDVCSVLVNAVNGFKERANASARAIREFLVQSTGDKATVDALSTKYEKRFGSQSDEIVKLKKDIDAARQALDSWTDDYEQAVAIAATTPTYVWVFPFGTVAASVVAGVYTDRALDALKQMKAVQAKIDRLNAALQRATQVMMWLGIANDGLGNLCQRLTAAIPVIQEMAGTWGSIASDLENLQQIVAKDVSLIGETAIELALDEWQSVSDAANEYRVHAYVTVEGTPTPLPKRAA